MALKGDLRDLSLANLIQMICLDQRQIALTLNRSDSSEGNIIFDNGQVIYARVGALVGADAIYHLLSWTDGVFEMSDRQSLPQKNVTESWNQLLMEGMRLIDEQGLTEAEADNSADLPLTAAEIEQDNALEDAFILLLSNLEQQQVQLVNGRQDKSILVLNVLIDVVNEVAAFAETLPHADKLAHTSNLITTASQTYSTARLLRVRQNRLSSDVVSRLYSSWTGDLSERQQTFREISLSLVIVIEKYLAQFIEQFRSKPVAQQWQETCNVFLNELNQKVNQIQF